MNNIENIEKVVNKGEEKVCFGIGYRNITINPLDHIISLNRYKNDPIDYLCLNFGIYLNIDEILAQSVGSKIIANRLEPCNYETSEWNINMADDDKNKRMMKWFLKSTDVGITNSIILQINPDQHHNINVIIEKFLGHVWTIVGGDGINEENVINETIREEVKDYMVFTRNYNIFVKDRWNFLYVHYEFT
jgi:hypothetical protein